MYVLISSPKSPLVQYVFALICVTDARPLLFHVLFAQMAFHKNDGVSFP